MKASALVFLFLPLSGIACGNSSVSGGTDGGTTRKLPSPAWDWAGVIGTGQSLAVGVMGIIDPPKTSAYGNLELSLGALSVPPLPDPTSGELSMIPLGEPIRPLSTGSVEWPANIFGETPHTAMADEITSLYMAAGGADYVTAHTVVGESGKPMTAIEKGAVDDGTMGRAYSASLFEAQAITKLATTAGKSYGVGAVVITHGEADAGNNDYESELFQMQSDYTTDLQAITGQTESVPLLVSQQQSVPQQAGSGSASTLAQWKAGVDHPGEIVCTGPKYQYQYFSDGVHLVADSYDQLGEKYGQVFFESVVMAESWQPLQPISASASGKVINVQFHVPVGPLAWDEGIVAPQGVAPEWVNGRGFEVTLASAPEQIQSVQITGAGGNLDTVQITCADAVEGQIVSVAYAYSAGSAVTMTADANGLSFSNRTLRWGQLRDSDPFVGATTGVAQPNYAVSFSISVPYASSTAASAN